MALLYPLNSMLAYDKGTYLLNFSESQFCFDTNENGLTKITSKDYIYTFGSEITNPALPLVSVNINIPFGKVIIDTKTTFTKKCLSKKQTKHI